MTVKDPTLRCIFLLHDVSKLLPIFRTVLGALVVTAICIAAGLERAAVRKEKEDPCGEKLQSKECTACQSR